MTILVTGSSGWLGRFLIPLLHKAGYKTLGFDPAPAQWTDITASIADRAALDKAFSEHDITGVIHAGALHKPDIARYNQQAFIDVNVTGTLNLLELTCQQKDIPFIFTSTTSLMISQQIRNEESDEAIWLNEEAGPIEPRNIYGVTKHAAENLCRQHHLEKGLNTIILRTSRFFPEADDTITEYSGANLKANELLYRRATVQDMARAHLVALEKAAAQKFGLYLVSGPTPFTKDQTKTLKQNPKKVIESLYPEAADLYENANWQFPTSIGRVYDGSNITRDLGFSYQTNFQDVLTALKEKKPLPVEEDESYTSPLINMT